jgi:4-amino-4-deoxychorismate lyase
MSLLLETICIENRQIRNPEYHNRRLNSARRDLFGIRSELDVRTIVKIPIGMGMDIFKCRILYDNRIREIQILPHHPGQVGSLKLVKDESIDYRYKYADRKKLENLLRQKDDCDDILIVKNGCISDTSYSNIVFRTPTGTWVTPDTPLLRGTMRESLLQEGQISERRIRTEDLSDYTEARMINCMMDLATGSVIRMNNIIP